MKRCLLLVPFIVLGTFCHAQKPSSHTKKSTIKPLTAIDRKNYVMTVDQITVSMTKYSLPKDNDYNKPVLFVPVKFTNNSNDILKYLTMTCSWEEFYTTDNQKIALIPGKNCDTNFPKDLALGPHKTIMVTVPIVKMQRGKKFRIGMTLIKVDKRKDSFDYPIDKALSLRDRDKYTIWSNLIELP
jgi:hypothetical protein